MTELNQCMFCEYEDTVLYLSVPQVCRCSTQAADSAFTSESVVPTSDAKCNWFTRF